MANCEAYRDQLLDLVYDVVDETEAKVLRAHLEACADCRTEFTRAQAEQTALARAAMPIGPDAVPPFTRPAATTPAAEVPPATIAFAAPAPAPTARRSVRHRYYWVGGAAAAAVVLLVAGLGWREYTDGHNTRSTAVDQQKEVIHEIDAQLAALEPRFKREADEVDRKLRAQAPLHLYVLGPTRLSSDGGDAVQVAVNNIDGQPVPATITATLTDAGGKKVWARQETQAANGMAAVALGDGLAKALAGQKDVRLTTEATWGSCTASLAETLPVAAPTYVAHLMTNKSVYRPGDLLFYRALVLDRSGLTPPEMSIPLQVSLVDATGKVVLGVDAPTGPGGIAAGELAVDSRFGDGAYELRVAAVRSGAPEVRPHARKLQVSRDVYFQAQADRDRYRAGEIVNVGVQRQLGQNAVAGRAMDQTNNSGNWSLSVNGKHVPLMQGQPAGGTGGAQSGPSANTSRFSQNTAPGGPQNPPSFGGPGGYAESQNSPQMNYFQFALPKDLDTSRVRVRIELTEGNHREAFEQELAVVPARLTVDVYPEGGDLVPGVPNRVYYQVRSPRGEPVNPDGRVIILSGSDVLLDSAPGEGAGSFTFTPQPRDSYSVRITGADGESSELPDPFVRLGGPRENGLALYAPQAVASENDPLAVVLRNAGPARRVLVVAQCRGHSVGMQWALAQGAETPVALGNLPGARGIVRLTAYEESKGALRPLAERLLYRVPARRLELTALHLGGVISPRLGQRGVQLELRARDENGAPLDCWGTALAVDERFRTREPSPLAHFFIAGEVRDGEDLDNAALIAADNPQARQALELFLGTTGWRRFQPAAAKVVAAAVPGDLNLLGRENASPRALEAHHEAKVEEAMIPLRLGVQQKHGLLLLGKQRAQGALEQARTDLRSFEALPQQYLRLGLGLATVILFGMACVMLAIGAWRLARRHGATPLFAGSFACLGLCLIATMMLASVDAPIEGRVGSVAQLDDLLRLPAWLNLAPRVEHRDSFPTGPFAEAGNAARRNREEKMAEQVPGDVGGKGGIRPINISGIATDRPAAAATARGAPANAEALSKDGASKTKSTGGEYNLRFQQAKLAQEHGALSRPSVAAPTSQPVPGPPIPAPPVPAPPAPAPKAAADIKGKMDMKEVLREAEKANRQFAYTSGSEYDTLLWDPSVQLPAGSAQVAFDVPASAGTYRVIVIGHTADGRLGFYEGLLDVQPTDLAR
jgi:hypothetical protein